MKLSYSGIWHGVLSASLLVSSTTAIGSTGANRIELVAGNAGAGKEPKGGSLDGPFGVDADPAGNLVIVEISGHRVMRLDSGGKLLKIAGTGQKGYRGDGGSLLSAQFNQMHNLAIAPNGDIYIADTHNSCVRKIDAKSSLISTAVGTAEHGDAGDGGPATKAKCGHIYCVALDPSGERLYVVDLDHRRIRVVSLVDGKIKAVAGNGKRGVPRDGDVARESPLVDPRAVAADAMGNVYILEREGHAVRVVDSTGRIRTIVGTGKKGLLGDDGPALKAQLNGPKHLCLDREGNLIIADTENHVIRKYLAKEKRIIRLAGTGRQGAEGTGGPPLAAQLKQPHGVFVDRAGTLYIVDSGNNRLLRIVTNHPDRPTAHDAKSQQSLTNVRHAMRDIARFMAEHREITRRYFLSVGAGASAALTCIPQSAHGDMLEPALSEAVKNLESILTLPDKFQDVSRGTPLPHSLPDAKKREVGLTRDTWRLEINSDPEHPAKIRKPLTKATGTAIDFAALVKLGEKHAVRFPKVMTCLNIGCPLGMGIWEGVPLRELVWLTQPRENLRRVFYYGYHNDDPKQMFRSSLPIGRVLDDPFDLPPVIVCYKLNGQWLTPERGGPVRIVVPEAYGFKSIKWLSHVVLTNLSHANDTYAGGNNDVDSPLKTFAATLSVPRTLKPGQSIPVTGYAQVGIGGLSKVQVWIHPEAQALPPDDRYFATAPWKDAQILPPPTTWGGGLPGDTIPTNTLGFDSNGRPRSWPLRLCKVHWAWLFPGLPSGGYTLRCRAIDEKENAQPMPNPFRKSGHAAIENISVVVQ